MGRGRLSDRMRDRRCSLLRRRRRLLLLLLVSHSRVRVMSRMGSLRRSLGLMMASLGSFNEIVRVARSLML